MRTTKAKIRDPINLLSPSKSSTKLVAKRKNDMWMRMGRLWIITLRCQHVMLIMWWWRRDMSCHVVPFATDMYCVTQPLARLALRALIKLNNRLENQRPLTQRIDEG
jgi:hypothetical protein